MKENLVSLKKEAERRGISYRSLLKRCAAGEEPLARKHKNGRWMFVQGGQGDAFASADWEVPLGADKEELDRLHKYGQAMKVKEEAQLKRAERLRLTGNLVDRSSLEQGWATTVVNIRTQMMTIPGTIRRQLGAERIDAWAYGKIVDIVHDALRAGAGE